MCYSEALAIEKRPKMRCNRTSKSPSHFLPVPSFILGHSLLDILLFAFRSMVCGAHPKDRFGAWAEEVHIVRYGGQVPQRQPFPF